MVAPYLATLAGGLLANLLFSHAALFGYLVAGVGDAAAEPVGTRFGRHRYRVPALRGIPCERSLEGSGAVFIASALSLLVGLAMTPSQALSPHALPAALGIAALATLALGEAATLLDEKTVTSYSLDVEDETTIVRVTLNPGGGMTVTGSAAGFGLLRAVLADGSDLCDTINIPFSDETATMPGDEAEGGLDYLFLSQVSGRIKRSWKMKWAGLFGTLDTPSEGGAKYSRDAIKSGYPAVTGLGEYWHYAVAYAYRAEMLEVSDKLLPALTRRWIKCNMGWGPNAASEWHDYYDVFFTSNYKIWNGPTAQ